MTVGPVILENLKMSESSGGYIDAMHGVLSHKGWITCSKPMLAGMTASAFRFTVNRRLTAESVTAYNWMADNFVAADFIGITVSQWAGFHFSPTFPLYQKRAVGDIKDAINSGTGAVLWRDKFVIAAGYDDSCEILYISDGGSDAYSKLAYSEFGRNISPYWYVQVFEDRVAADELGIYRESLLQAVNKWESHDLMLPDAEYACGRSAYQAIIAALENGNYDPDGLQEIIYIYGAAKHDISRYLAELEQIWPQLHEAAEAYDGIAQLFMRLKDWLAAIGPGNKADTSETGSMISCFAEAWELEEAAMQCLKRISARTADNRFHDIALR